jgi:hypothetical protein
MTEQCMAIAPMSMCLVTTPLKNSFAKFSCSEISSRELWLNDDLTSAATLVLTQPSP